MWARILKKASPAAWENLKVEHVPAAEGHRGELLAGMDEEFSAARMMPKAEGYRKHARGPLDGSRAASAGGSQRRGDLFIFRSTQMASREAASAPATRPAKAKSFCMSLCNEARESALSVPHLLFAAVNLLQTR